MSLFELSFQSVFSCPCFFVISKTYVACSHHIACVLFCHCRTRSRSSNFVTCWESAHYNYRSCRAHLDTLTQSPIFFERVRTVLSVQLLPYFCAISPCQIGSSDIKNDTIDCDDWLISFSVHVSIQYISCETEVNNIICRRICM